MLPVRSEDPVTMPPTAVWAGLAGAVLAWGVLQIIGHFVQIPGLYRNVCTGGIALAFLVPFLIVRARLRRADK